MPDNTHRTALDIASRHIRDSIASGFADEAEISRELRELTAYSIPELRPRLESMLRYAIDSKLRIERSWPAVTDCDRFDAAFADLEQQGIVCRHNFSCCGTCAAAEIEDEIAAEQGKAREIIGCAHYNIQDTESAVAGDGVCLSYGSVLNSERAWVQVGHQVADAMKAHGLKVNWNGSLSKRIHVALDWKRRLPRPSQPS